MNTNVLIISNPDDEHTRSVIDKLHGLDCTYYLMFPEQFSTSLSLALEHSLTKDGQLMHVYDTNCNIDLTSIDAVWYRRPRLVAAPTEISAEGLEFARDEWRAALEAVYALMTQPLWVSHPDKLKQAARKPLQLQLARTLGLRTPRTLITNDPAAARSFFEACAGKLIAKPTGSGWVYVEDSEDYFFVMTNRVAGDELALDEQLRVAPVTFQEEIPKAYELRVNVVGQEVLAIKIDSQQSPVSALDWRRYDVANTPYSPYELPKEVAKQCLQLTRCLGLEFGAIDLIRQPDGEYVFLEINGNGQFLWAEQLSGVDVSTALARLLAGVAPPLRIASLS